MFSSRADHLDEFCFRRKRIEKMCFDYARNSYRDEFINFPSRDLPQFSHGPNHHSYNFGSLESRFVPERFGYGPRLYRGDRFSRRPGFSIGDSHTHSEPRHLDGPRFPCRGSHPTRSRGEVLKK
jgi:hypothetical protein